MTRVRVQVMPKGTVLDPQGATVERSLPSGWGSISGGEASR